MKKTSICIVGSGTGGATLAKELSKIKNISLTIIDIDNLDNSFNQKLELKNIIKFNNNNSNIHHQLQRGYGFGGTSNLWHGIFTELDRSDLYKIDREIKFNISNSILKYYKILRKSYNLISNEIEIFSEDEIYKVFNSQNLNNFKYLLFNTIIIF